MKVDDVYYLFYTCHTDSAALEYKEKVMVARGNSPVTLEKVAGWEITPPDEPGQKNDFRDPQAYYDPETGKITLTVTSSQGADSEIHAGREPAASGLRRDYFYRPGGRLLEPGVQRHLPDG